MVIPEDATLETKIRMYVSEFEKGCSDTCQSGKPEDCPECVRAFVDAVTRAVAGLPQVEHGNARKEVPVRPFLKPVWPWFERSKVSL
jgi:hypothetical protein